MTQAENENSFTILQPAEAEPMSVLDHVNDIIAKKRREKKNKKEHLSEWGNMKRKEKTDELKLQWKLIQHENLAEKSEYHKVKKDEKMPQFFQVATLVNGNHKIKVGAGQESQSLHTSNRRKKKCLSALQQLERDKDMKDWCVKRYTKIQREKNIGGKSFVRKQRRQLLKMKKS